MKVILSRKGFDGSNGGMPSMILKDGRLVSFPIPSDDKDTYGDLQVDGKPFSTILREFDPNFDKDKCHIDPDITSCYRAKKDDNWKPAFGQGKSALSYLVKADVKEGDIFLFFGNYHRVDVVNGKYTFRKEKSDNFYDYNDIQLIWGYLQVGEIIRDFEEMKERFGWHPHAADREKYRKIKDKNALFIPTEKLTLPGCKGIAGCGILPYSDYRVLTLRDHSKSNWKLNWDNGETYYGVKDTNAFNKRKNSSKDSKNAIYYKGIWQELVLNEGDKYVEWAKSIITHRD